MIDKFPLQLLVERHDCRYFAENHTGDGEVLNLALRSPFVRLYALNRSEKTVEAHRQRFQDNERVQLFHWSHDESWREIVRLIPYEQPSVFWIHPSENVGRALMAVAGQRPLRSDVVIFELGGQRAARGIAARYFSRTHRLRKFNPRVWFSEPVGGSLVTRKIEPVADPPWILSPR